MKTTLIAQGRPGGPTLEAALAKAVAGQGFDRIEVAVAYATLQGVRTLEALLTTFPPESRWVIGLDDAISQPEALEYLMAAPGATVRLAALAPARRFHPKLYCLSSSVHADRCVSAIGSGNMTLNGLRRNGETAVVLTAETADDTDALRTQWRSMWALGQDATQAAIDTYRARYKAAREARRIVEKLGAAPPEPAPEAPVEIAGDFDASPASASVGWTEGASPSAGGRELEFPFPMMPYFRLAASPTTRRFHMPNGQAFPLTFTMRPDNGMWRLGFSRDSIFAAVGRETLRPLAGGNRSDLAVAFKRRIDGDFDVWMAVIGSPEHSQLIEASKAVGGLDRTRGRGGRNFGVY